MTWLVEPSNLGRIVIPPAVPAGFAVFCTTRDFAGRLSQELAGEITRCVRDRFGVEATLASCTQVHGVAVAHASKETSWRECDACDALWADEPGVALAIKIADCLPVTIIDPVHRVVANVHSGWRGAAQNIVAKTLETLAAKTTFDPSSALAYLGPSIRACCFEVGEEVAAQFDARYADRGRPKPHLDLAAFSAGVLRGGGIAPERIDDSGLCTRCEGSIFHSFRRDGRGGGRNLAIAGG